MGKTFSGRVRMDGWNEREKMNLSVLSMTWNLQLPISFHLENLSFITFILMFICKGTCSINQCHTPKHLQPKLICNASLAPIQSIIWINSYITHLKSLVCHPVGSTLRQVPPQTHIRTTISELFHSCQCHSQQI